ncbi:hypothetical protein SAMN04488061_3031 [Filomicrobium insigne]|uniref:VOC domain-containing protein n=1 Tax=Filomicrobium insigne TaxID=418854 RepID=A0A1H0SUL2_9HYPH|nr:VOC family protein [Filomicrobium insigne]SDP44966.1 hypothetical protein SAMN04488061_3031 [Filomicrobium insigne]
MPKMIFLNLPVKDLAAATRFYEAIGCTKNDQFSDENASSMMWSDAIVFHLLTHDYFSTFAHKPIADAHRSVGMLIALSCGRRSDVDEMVDAAAAAGGTADPRERQDMGFMYVRSFVDPDGHVFEPAWMDMSAMGGA